MSTRPCSRTNKFMESATPQQFEWMLSHYDKCLRAKAESKSQKPENIIKLDKWYQNELPKKIQSRKNEPHLVYDEIVQTIKWKLARGKFRPSLTNLVQMNTPRVVLQETKKAFKFIYKKEDLLGAVTSMCNLKGVGPAMASAVLSAGAPHMAPFMADEVLLAMPDADGIDYTIKEYMRLAEYVETVVERLNNSLTDEDAVKFTPHKVELSVWCHYIANDLLPELLESMPNSEGHVSTTTTTTSPKSETEEVKDATSTIENENMTKVETNNNEQHVNDKEKDLERDTVISLNTDNGDVESGCSNPPTTDEENSQDSITLNQTDDVQNVPTSSSSTNSAVVQEMGAEDSGLSCSSRNSSEECNNTQLVNGNEKEGCCEESENATTEEQMIKNETLKRKDSSSSSSAMTCDQEEAASCESVGIKRVKTSETPIISSTS